MLQKLLFKSIKDAILKEEEDLKNIDKGIFFAPELALAYLIGKSIFENRENIFNTSPDKVLWKREVNLKNGGPSDIIFEVLDNSGSVTYYVIEVKLRDTVHAYQRDINKLKALDGNHRKFFCALIDTFDKENDPRIKTLEEENSESVSRVDDFMIFKTNQDWYVKDIYCVVGFWEVN